MMLAYFCCHLLGMSSSCTNPFIYAFLNESFAAELRYMAINVTRKLLRCGSSAVGYNTSIFIDEWHSVLWFLEITSENYQKYLQCQPELGVVASIEYATSCFIFFTIKMFTMTKYCFMKISNCDFLVFLRSPHCLGFILCENAIRYLLNLR